MTTIAAVVVTFNRKVLLQECLAALLRQTRPPDRIIVVDNASGDGTPSLFASGNVYADNATIDYLRLETNTGGAGGFRAGVQRARDLGLDWIWVMDDDAEPALDALEALLPQMARPGTCAVASLPVDREGRFQASHRGWADLRGLAFEAHRSITAADVDQVTRIDFASFVGLAFTRDAVLQIGLPKADMFIKCDDLEYCLRLARVGPIYLVPTSVIVHKEAANVGRIEMRRLGTTSYRESLDRLWLQYFGIRNLVWLRRTYCGAAFGALYAVVQMARSAFGILLFDTDRRVRLRFFAHSIWDGWVGRFDNRKPRTLTAVGRAVAR